MLVTQKNRYALRAIFELAKRLNEGPVKIAEIAEAQAIPPRFLEVILNQLKKAGFVTAKRGFTGGYTLLRSPEDITVGELFRSIDESHENLICATCISKNVCPFHNECAFLPMWNQVQNAIHDVFDNTTIQKLIENEKMMKR